MALNPQQIFANHILQKVVPSLQGNPAVATYVSNLDANSKKFLGQMPGETLDAKTYGERTKSDLAGIAAALGSNAGADISSSLASVAERFGVAPAAAVAAVASAHVGGGSTVAFDVGAALAARADEAGEDLDWKNSVVDLLKLFGKDSSVGARRTYMTMLGLDGGAAGSADGNTALHGALLKTIAANGGNLPSNLA